MSGGTLLCSFLVEWGYFVAFEAALERHHAGQARAAACAWSRRAAIRFPSWTRSCATCCARRTFLPVGYLLGLMAMAGTAVSPASAIGRPAPWWSSRIRCAWRPSITLEPPATPGRAGGLSPPRGVAAWPSGRRSSCSCAVAICRRPGALELAEMIAPRRGAPAGHEGAAIRCASWRCSTTSRWAARAAGQPSQRGGPQREPHAGRIRGRAQAGLGRARRPAGQEAPPAQAAARVDFARRRPLSGDLLRSHARRARPATRRTSSTCSTRWRRAHSAAMYSAPPYRLRAACGSWSPLASRERAAQRPLHGSGRRAVHAARAARLRRRPSLARLRPPDHARVDGRADGEVLQRLRPGPRRRRRQHDGQLLRLQQRRHRLSLLRHRHPVRPRAACSFSSTTASPSAWWPGP